MDFLKLGSLGSIVELLQSTLKKLGFYDGYIDGIFGPRTESAVRNFQSEFGLSVDGFVGEKTWNALSHYFNGYTTYTIRSGDTLYELASRFQTSVNQILFHNPNIIPNSLRVGQEIIIPFGSIVPTDVSYSYDILQMNLRALTTIYPFLEISSIGKSVLGNDLSLVRFGRGRNEVFYNASFHANEWITSVLLMKFLEDICKAYVDNISILGYSIRNLFENTSIYFVPMVNPDGVNLVTGAYPVNGEIYQQALQISNNYPSVPFPRGWKANIQGESFINFHFLFLKNNVVFFYTYIILYLFYTTLLLNDLSLFKNSSISINSSIFSFIVFNGAKLNVINTFLSLSISILSISLNKQDLLISFISRNSLIILFICFSSLLLFAN